MAGDAPAPQYTPQADPDNPYLEFVAAFLRQVVADARRTPTGTGHWTETQDGWTASRQREAQEFLLDLHRLAPWVELTGADVDKLQGMLLHAAGLANLGAHQREHIFPIPIRLHRSAAHESQPEVLCYARRHQ